MDFSSSINSYFEPIRQHNMYVQSVVPKEDLLVWNLKDGWEPLCEFLGKPIPEGPIAHDNKTGDPEWIRNYGFRHKMFAKGMRNLAVYILLFIFKCVLGIYLMNACYRRFL